MKVREEKNDWPEWLRSEIRVAEMKGQYLELAELIDRYLAIKEGKVMSILDRMIEDGLTENEAIEAVFEDIKNSDDLLCDGCQYLLTWREKRGYFGDEPAYETMAECKCDDPDACPRMMVFLNDYDDGERWLTETMEKAGKISDRLGGHEGAVIADLVEALEAAREYIRKLRDRIDNADKKRRAA